MTIAHLSDLHFGRIADSGIVDALLAEVNGRAVDLAVLSGDLTQRARPEEFEAAQALLEAFEVPTLVVPGNHDVYPWWRPYRRLRTPLRRYRRYISDDLAPKVETETGAVLGLSSAYGATIKGGRIGPDDRAEIQEYFGGMEAGTFKVLVLHHHLTKIQSLGPHDVARQAQKALDTAADVGVGLILCGHLHISHIEPLEIIPGEHRMVIASAGTATSNRWRGSEGPTNFYNLISVEDDEFTIEERRYVPDKGHFERDGITTFDRQVSAHLSREENN